MITGEFISRLVAEERQSPALIELPDYYAQEIEDFVSRRLDTRNGEQELANTQPDLKDLLTLRERKIALLAMYNSTGRTLEVELHGFERVLFENLVKVFKKYEASKLELIHGHPCLVV